MLLYCSHINADLFSRIGGGSSNVAKVEMSTMREMVRKLQMFIAGLFADFCNFPAKREMFREKVCPHSVYNVRRHKVNIYSFVHLL